ncbi:MAG: NAD-dependent epimerase/dehydratase family protein, partial [Chlamydiae bacterium]|nr:NAD-dependent epimerase/dehydratase family protein [Chlamydiota bacterium]
MKIVIAGAHGFIGTAVSAHLEKSGHNVVRLSRKEGEPNFWDPQNGQLDPALLEGADVVINLAGES